jgi:site-specific recombinase XerD
MDIENLIAVFERKLIFQRYSDGSIKNYSSSARSFLQVAEKRFDQPDELNENEIEKYVYRKIRKDYISSSYRFANVLF